MTTQPQTKHTPDAAARYWRLPAVKTYTGRSRSAIYRDTTFPKPIKLGPNTSAWIAEEVRAWCEQRDAEAVAARAEPHPRAALMLAAKRARAGAVRRTYDRTEAATDSKVTA
jgi:prophage regulatory protein